MKCNVLYLFVSFRYYYICIISRSSRTKMFFKKAFLEISQNLQENTCNGVSGLDDKANWLSTGPSFKIRWANCLIFLFWLVCYLVHFFEHVFVYGFIYESNCNNRYFSRTSFVNFLEVNIFLFSFFFKHC